MIPQIVIRNETDADVAAIAEVTVAAFMTLEISNHTEQFIIQALRAAKALAISLVAEADGRVIGHWHSSDGGGIVKTERSGGHRLLSRGASGLLQEIWVQEHAWARA